LEDPDTTPQRSAFRFPSLASEIDAGLKLGFVSKLLDRWVVAPPVVDEACQTDWVAGASMMVRTNVFDQIGLMDERYFLYFEEVDFCFQAARYGWSCWYVPESRVVHFVGQSTGVTNPTDRPKRLPQYWFDSRKRYFQKNYGSVYQFLADTLLMLSTLLWEGRRQLQRKPGTNPPYFLQDIYRNSAWAKLVNPLSLAAAKDQNPAVQHQAYLQSLPSEKTLAQSLGLRQLVREDLATYDGDWTRPGFQAIALQRFGAWRMTIKFRLFRLPFSFLYQFFYVLIRNVYGVELPYTVKLGRRVILEHQHGIVIHGNCVIGDDCIIRQGVTIGNRYVEKPFDAPILGDRVNIGAGAKILGKITLGNDVNIGANAVILNSVPAGKTAVGIPGKIIN
jgi:serine acetyltransferase